MMCVRGRRSPAGLMTQPKSPASVPTLADNTTLFAPIRDGDGFIT